MNKFGLLVILLASASLHCDVDDTFGTPENVCAGKPDGTFCNAKSQSFVIEGRCHNQNCSAF